MSAIPPSVDDEKKCECDSNTPEDANEVEKKEKLLKAYCAFLKTKDRLIRTLEKEFRDDLNICVVESIQHNQWWETNLRKKYNITDEDIESERTSKQDNRKKEIKRLEKEIKKWNNKMDELKSKWMNFFENQKDDEGNPLYSEYDEDGIPISFRNKERIKPKQRKALTAGLKDYERWHAKYAHHRTLCRESTVKKAIIQLCVNTASIGPVLTNRILKYAKDNGIDTVDKWRRRVQSKTMQDLVPGINTERVEALYNMDVVMQLRMQTQETKKK
eukprot:204470_1